jgi:hypothetical protein
MDSTKFAAPNADMENILELCTKIRTTGACDEVLSKPSADLESYYCDRADLRLYDAELFEYDFATPAELRSLLLHMWEYQQCNHMKEFAAAATIATFHNKKEEPDGNQGAIPAFIYNF